jgi:hypothetical protein
MLSTMRAAGWLAKMKWWHLLLGGCAGFALALVAMVILIRWNGFSKYHQAIDDLTSEGFPTTGERMLKELPVIDDATQQRFRALMPAIEVLDTRTSFNAMLNESTVLDEIITQGVMPPKIADFLRDHAADFNDLRELLRGGKLVLGMGEWIRQQAKTESEDSAILTSHPMSFRQIGCFLRLAALGGDVQALDDLAHLRACLRPASSTDVNSISMVNDLRDECFLDLVLMGKGDPERVNRWTKEPFTVHADLAMGLRGDIFSLCSAEQELHDFPLFGDYLFPLPGTGIWERSLQWGKAGGMAGLDWLFLGRDVGLTLRWTAALARRMESGGGGVALVPTDRFLSPVGGMTLYSMYCSVLYPLEKSVRHRAIRLAVLLVDQFRRQGRLPADEAELLRVIGDSHALDSVGDLPPLEYQRADDTSFRIVRKPGAPVVKVMPLPELLVEQPYTSNLKSGMSTMATLGAVTPPLANRMIVDTKVELRIPVRQAAPPVTSPAPPGDSPRP